MHGTNYDIYFGVIKIVVVTQIFDQFVSCLFDNVQFQPKRNLLMLLKTVGALGSFTPSGAEIFTLSQVCTVAYCVLRPHCKASIFLFDLCICSEQNQRIVPDWSAIDSAYLIMVCSYFLLLLVIFIVIACNL